MENCQEHSVLPPLLLPLWTPGKTPHESAKRLWNGKTYNKKEESESWSNLPHIYLARIFLKDTYIIVQVRTPIFSLICYFLLYAQWDIIHIFLKHRIYIFYLNIFYIFFIYRVAAIFPERFQCFTVALKKIFYNNFFLQNRLSCLSKHNYKQTVTFQQRWINRRA